MKQKEQRALLLKDITIGQHSAQDRFPHGEHGVRIHPVIEGIKRGAFGCQRHHYSGCKPDKRRLMPGVRTFAVIGNEESGHRDQLVRPEQRKGA